METNYDVKVVSMLNKYLIKWGNDTSFFENTWKDIIRQTVNFLNISSSRKNKKKASEKKKTSCAKCSKILHEIHYHSKWLY